MADHTDAALDNLAATTDDQPTTTDAEDAADVSVGDVFRTDLGDRLEITNRRVKDGVEMVCVYHPDRPATDGETYTVWRPRESVATQVAYEDMKRVETAEDAADAADAPDPEQEPLGEFTDAAPPNCPSCGRFMDCRQQDGMGLPTAVCTRPGCGTFLDDCELIDAGYFRET